LPAAEGKLAMGPVRHPLLAARRLKMVDGQTAVVVREDQRDSEALVEKQFVEVV
jgi:hypothetical protein